jgi:hypothetical protein
LFYRSGTNQMMSAEVLPDATFAAGERRVLFSAVPYQPSFGSRNYDVTTDGERFLMIRAGARDPGELILVENWFEELKAKVGN